MIGTVSSLGAVLQADHLGLDLGLPVRPYPLQPVRLVQGVMIRYPVDGRRGDVDEALYAVAQGGIEDVAGALHIGGVDVLGRVEGQGRRGVDDEVGALYGPVHQGFVPYVAFDDLDPVALGIVELLHVEEATA